jgi:DNA-binding response OmpR family regulator
MAKVLIVEDDASVAQLLKFTLESERYILDHCTNCADALAALRTTDYDLLILDWALPDSTGVELCSLYRSMGGNKPVLMLTARGTPRDKVAGLTAGADDYVVKPFDPDELVARVRALLRRPPTISSPVLKVSSIELDTLSFQVTKEGQTVILQPKEFAVLRLLMEHPDRYFTAEAILARLWRSDASVSTDSVRTHIKNLRKKLGDSNDDPIIENRKGLGYRLKVRL